MKTDGGIDPAATGLQDSGDVFSSTVASFLGRRMAHYERPGGTKDTVMRSLQTRIGAETQLGSCSYRKLVNQAVEVLRSV